MIDDMESINHVVETQTGSSRDQFVSIYFARVELPASFEESARWFACFGAIRRCSTIFLEKGTASSSRETKVLRSAESSTQDFASANLYDATFRPKRMTARQYVSRVCLPSRNSGIYSLFTFLYAASAGATAKFETSKVSPAASPMPYPDCV